MPPVRTLVTPAAPAKDATEPKPSAALATLPKWATAVAPLPQIQNGPAAVYVGQLQPNTGKRQSLLAAGVLDGEYYLDNMGAVVPLKHFRFWLVDAVAFKTEMDAAGNIVAATRNMDDRTKGLQEHAIALVIVQTPGGVVPAKADFRKARAPAFSEAVKGVEAAHDPAFPKVSDAARIAAAFPVPWGRVVTAVTVEKKIARSGPGAGKPYFLSNGTVQPATVKELEALAAFLQSADSEAAVDQARASFDYRVKQIEKLCKD
jgi:hypothetical protein